MIPLKNLTIFKTILLTYFIVGISFIASAQNDEEEQTPQTVNVYKGTSAEKVKTKFNKPEIELKKSGLVSNVLKIINTSSNNLNFTVDVLLPAQWSTILDPNKIYSLAVHDTIVVPVLLVPSKVNTGSSEIIINTFLIDIDGEQIGDNSFLLKTKKKTKWDLEVKTANRFYFKNEEFDKKFEYSIVNKGNYKQDISVNHSIPRKDLYLSDTIDEQQHIIDKHSNISLDVGEEADFSYYASAIKVDERNKRKVSTNNYTPYENKYYKKYDLVINSSEDKKTSATMYKKNAKVSFIKLPNEINLQDYGYPSLPVTMDMYIQNILSDYPFMSVNFRGLKKINEDANLVYSTQLNFSKNYNDGNSNRNIPWNIAYFDDKKSIEFGQITSGISGVSTYGDGVRASYRFRRQSISAFYIGSGGLFNNPTNISYGGSHYFRLGNFFGLSTQLGRTENSTYKRKNTVVSLSPYIYLGRKLNLNANVSQSLNENEITTSKIKGYQYRATLSSRLIRNVNTTLNGMYRDNKFNAANVERLTATHKTYVKLNNKWSTYISNNYQKTITPTYRNTLNKTVQETFFNRLMISKKTKNGSIQTGAFYDYKNYLNTELENRGITIRNSSFNYEKNLLSSLIIRTGYSKNLLVPDSKDIFNFDFTSLLRYQIWNFTFKYNYGNQATNSINELAQNNIVPQYVRFSVQNQYVLKNNRFVLQTNANYSYRNVASNNTFGFYPELFYFSKTNWRYSLQMSYSYNTSDYSDILDNEFDGQFRPNYSGKTKNSNLTIGMSIRKDFGIPIPFAKKKTADVTFVAFQDINGNSIKDRDEDALDNIVITFGTEEVITNNRGVAKINKVPFNKYSLKVLALEDLKGWFPNISDSILVAPNEVQYIPYVKGVKLYGDVIMDRQKIAITDEKPIDLSRIKISATKDKSYSTLTDKNGHFEFYLPNGDYILTMDDSILSSSLRLSRNNIPVVLKNNQDGYYLSFYILEKRRKVIIRDFSKKKK